jgi:phosphatidylserine/phosphatidylglycerophosphate/cardiolipin synthase-like enzyme
MRRQQIQRNDAQRYGLMGTGAIATVLSLYHFLSQFSGTPTSATDTFTNSPTNYTSPLGVNLPGAGQVTAQIARDALGNLVNYTGALPTTLPSQTGSYSGIPTTSPPVATGDVQAFVFRATASAGAVANEISRAQRQVLVQAFSIHSEPIVKALAEARRRGVDVFVVMDASQQADMNSAANYLASANIQTVLNADRTLPNTKVILIDGHTIITGAFDNSDRTSDEHIFVIRNRSDIYANFDASFMANYQRSQPYSARSNTARTTGYTPPTTQTPFSTASVPTGKASTPPGGYTTTPIQPGNYSNAPLSTRQWESPFNRANSPSMPNTRR